MIFTFRFISDEVDSFILDVNINHDQTFEELHNKIQETLDYDPSQMASFYTSNEDWEKLTEIAQMDLGDGDDTVSMSEAKIGDYYTGKKQNLLYIFDFLSERLLFGSVVRTIDAVSPVTLPSVSCFEGEVPAQIEEMDEFDEDDFKTDYDDDYDPSDLEDLMGDMDGFNELPDDYY